MSKVIQNVRAAGGKGRGLALFLALGGLIACNELLEVDLPASVLESTLEAPESAELQVFSAVAFFECAYSELGYQALGHEDLWERLTGRAAPADYDENPRISGGRADRQCDGVDYSAYWYEGFHISRTTAEGVYDRMENDWTDSDVPDRAKLQVVAALYIAASIDIMGEYFCEMALGAEEDNPDHRLLSPTETLARGEEWIATALNGLAVTGDFEIEDGDITTSAETMAYGLRARMRWAKGDFAGALTDAEMVPMDFTAWVTRGIGVQRRNKVYSAGRAIPYGAMYDDVIDWWSTQSVVININPVTGQPWPNPIPFTGYVGLAILPDGRAVGADGLPIRTQADPGSIVDTRMLTVLQNPVGGQTPRHTPDKYSSESDPIPWISWREMWLIRAEIEGGQTAIDLVNDLRAHHGLPLVTYADPNDAVEIRYMYTEEKRRELFAEGGRFWSHKIQNTDLLWFPRAQGVEPTQGWTLFGGIRMIMPDSEYEQNPNFGLDDRATLCDPFQAPIGAF